MKKIKIITIIITLVILSVIILGKNYYLTNRQIKFNYPLHHALFPRDFTAPSFDWSDQSQDVKSWKITINLKSKRKFITAIVNKDLWTPDKRTWDSIKKYSNYENIEILVERNEPKQNSFFSSRAKLSIKISEDEVGAPVLYRQIPLPTGFAEEHINLTSYELCNVGKPQFHSVLDGFKVCGNCHSSTTDGSTIGLDFDAVRRDKGGYFIAKIDSEIVFNKDNYMSWSKLQGKNTFGLFSKISRGGRYVLTTIKDRVVFVRFDSLAYSQLFLPVNGVLSVLDRKTGKFFELPGANDTAYIQTNAVWTPDDKYIIFARAKALPYPKKNTEYDCFFYDKKIISEFISEKRDLKFDLYILPFNDGKGGKAEPIKGASNNGKSNYFPSISPDGKWLVFCQANNYMMLRPDSRLYIMPLKGGEPQKMICNFKSMNSWHDWSPNGKWLVYSSKAFSIFTDLFLTHIDEKGNASIPVLLEIRKRSESALNYPMFINRDPNRPFTMKYNYVNITDIQDALQNNDKEKAKKLLETYIQQNQIGTPIEYHDIGQIYLVLGNKKEAEKYYKLCDQANLKYNTSF